MNNSTEAQNSDSCNYCHVDLTKAELPIILIITLIFNSIAIAILFKIRKKSEQINHYLVTKVAINDIFSTIIFTVMWLGGWIKCGCMMNLLTCSILGWLATTAVIWSAWIVIVMSVCRYLATVKPIYYRTHITTLRVQIAIYATLAFTAAQLLFPFTGLVAPYQYYEDNFICAYNFSPGAAGSAHRGLIGFLSMEGLIVSVTTLFLNLSIVYEMRKKNTLINRQSAHMSVSTKPERSRHEIKIAFANVSIVVSAVFCVCYFPFLLRLMYDVIITNVELQDGFYHSITMSLLFLAPLLNPVVYVVCNKRYRSYVLLLLRKMCIKLRIKRSNKINFTEDNTTIVATCTSSTV